MENPPPRRPGRAVCQKTADAGLREDVGHTNGTGNAAANPGRGGHTDHADDATDTETKKEFGHNNGPNHEAAGKKSGA